MEQKICIICFEAKNLANFPKMKGCKLGYRRICKKCVNGHDPLTSEERKMKNEKHRIDKYDLKNNDLKICYRCNKEKHMCEYNFTKGIPNASFIECAKLPMTTEQRNQFENERKERYLAGASFRNERIDFCLFRQ